MTAEFRGSIGPVVSLALPRPRPQPVTLAGRHGRLEPVSARDHGAALFAGFAADPTGGLWDYMAVGPFATPAAFDAYLQSIEGRDDPLFFALVDSMTGKAGGLMSLMRIDPAHGVIEVGGIAITPGFMRTPAVTEAHALLMAYVFETLGYRRYEWKCNALNAPSRVAAIRLGFTFEGIFRQHMVLKGRNRDTAWYSLLDTEWPAVRAGFARWLAPANFDADGRQRQSLASLRST